MSDAGVDPIRAGSASRPYRRKREHGAGSLSPGVIPTGTITFLFTDIEGSTRLWENDPEAASAGVRHHDRLMRSAIATHDGYVFNTAGDSFAVAFDRAGDALATAVDAQRMLGAEHWPGPSIRVRMGLHAGEVEERDGDFFGPAVNSAARVCAAGHGGQILLTAAVEAMVATDRIDLGAHRLRDIAQPVELFQVRADGLAAEFPPVRSLDAVRSTLPVQRSSLVGRAEEVARVRRDLETARLVSLSGPGGVGKTRLAVEVAHRDLPTRGAAWFVDLAAVGDPSGITRAFVSGCEISIGQGIEPWRQVLDQLGGREALVVVDNCEHVIDEAAARIDALLAACPKLRVLATSREPLGVEGETVFRVPTLGSGADSPGVRLFVERAAAAAPDAGVKAATEGVTGVCRRLDGLPLALELAAARCASFSPAEIRDRLDDRFTLLSAGRRGGADRHRTLESAIAWSYDLLEPGEQTMLRALSIFPADFDLTAAAACADQPGSVAAQGMDSLVAQSLVLADTTGQQTRYRLLETIRSFARVRADEVGEIGPARDRHLDHFASTLADPLPGGEVIDRSMGTAARLRVEGADYLAALDWADHCGRGDVVAWLAPRLWGLWIGNALYDEGIAWTTRALQQTDLNTATRGACLNTLMFCLVQYGRSDEAVPAGIEAINTGGSTLEDNPELAWTYAFAAFSSAGWFQEELSRDLLQTAESLADQPGATGVQRGLVWHWRGIVRMYERELDAALDDFQASRRVLGELVPDHEYIPRDLIGEAVALHLLGRDDEALARCNALEEAFAWRLPDHVGFERAIRAVARAALGSPGDEQQLLLSSLPPEITRHTPILYVWLAAFGSLAEMAGDRDVARVLLETSAIWPNPLSPMSWEHLRRASGWSLAELADHQRSFTLADADSRALPADWARLLQGEVSRLRAH